MKFREFNHVLTISRHLQTSLVTRPSLFRTPSHLSSPPPPPPHPPFTRRFPATFYSSQRSKTSVFANSKLKRYRLTDGLTESLIEMRGRI